MSRLLLVLAASLLAAPLSAREASWEDQLKEMQHLIMQISAINAVNAMNLTPEQAAKLRGLARRVESAGAWRLKPGAKLGPRLETVRLTYADLRRVLIAGETVSPALKRRVGKARILEAQVIRESMAGEPKGRERTGECTRCHVRPGGGDVNSPAANKRLKRLRNTNERGTFMAHLHGLFGKGGAVALAQAASKIDAMLSPGQRDVIQTFSCCLIPPENLSDPVRAGQAEVSERSLKLLRSVRQATPGAWAWMKPMVLSRIYVGQKAMKPAISDQELAQTQRHVAAVLEKARAMSEVDFEMEKANLCRELKFAPSPDARSERTRRFMAAMLLLVPGMDDVYTEIIRRAGRRAG